MRQRDGRTVDLDGADVVAAALFTPLALTAGLSPLRTADWRLLGGGVPDPAQITARFGPGAARRVDDLLRRRAEVESDLAALARRGIHVVTVAHGRYPQRLLERLGDRAPAALFVAGDAALLSARGVAVVGSRDVDADGARSAAVIGRLAAKDHLTVFSGGARGVDRIAMSAALECDGSAVGVVAGAMDRGMQSLETRRLTQSGRLALVCPFLPSSPVNSATALGRNRLIYALAGKAVVVSSSADGGGHAPRRSGGVAARVVGGIRADRSRHRHWQQRSDRPRSDPAGVR